MRNVSTVPSRAGVIPKRSPRDSAVGRVRLHHKIGGDKSNEGQQLHRVKEVPESGKETWAMETPRRTGCRKGGQKAHNSAKPNAREHLDSDEKKKKKPDTMKVNGRVWSS